VTTTPRLVRRNHGKGHSYKLDGEKVIGVTSVLDAKSKRALIRWAATTTAAEALDRWDELAQMPPSERLKELEAAQYKKKTEAGVRGTRIHALAEKLAKGEEVEVPDDIVGPVEAYARFLDAWQFETWATETPCVNIKNRYAGTADGWGLLGLTGERVLLDVKTGKGVYSETALQLAAYRYTDLWQPDGPESEAPTPQVDAVYVAHVLPNAVRMLPVEAGESEFRQFLYTLQVARWDKAVEEDPVIGSAIYPEEIAHV
jgi:hypothetical protein